MTHTLYVEKYRPKKLDEFVGNDALKTQIKHFIDKNDIPNLLFYGEAGGGKTSLAKLIANELGAQYLYINASDKNGIDFVRDEIVPFASSIGFNFNSKKIVILDEYDNTTIQAQSALRNIIETYSSNTRFIITCNYINKLIDPIKSRFHSIKIGSPSKKEVAHHLLHILETEKVEYSKNDVASIINGHYPDFRKIINTLQGNIVDNKLVLSSNVSNYNEVLLSNIKDVFVSKDTFNNKYTNVRTIINSFSEREYEFVFRYLFDNINDITNDVPTAILLISKYQYEYNFVIDKEINIVALLIELLKLK
jgi:DNA polymerase III delta prime subunit